MAGAAEEAVAHCCAALPWLVLQLEVQGAMEMRAAAREDDAAEEALFDALLDVPALAPPVPVG